MILNQFHPALREWFERELGKPTEAQAQAWPEIKKGRHTLIAAPTGSGKTLAAFYAVINELIEKGLRDELLDQTQIVYVSPLKALSNDIHRNLEVPLAGIQQTLKDTGLAPVKISVAVRTGDTTTSERQKMMKKPPHILVTTPESLYLLLTSEGGRKLLKNVRTIIIDEIHALLGDKRGSHLALSVERLEALTQQPLQRIGLSATQKPIDLVARFLVGTKNIKNNLAQCALIDSGWKRKLDLYLEVPKSPLTAVMSGEVWTELYDRLLELIESHKTTLIFVNTRRLAERLARSLAERIGEDHVSSHHGSMSKEHRRTAERRLKAGELKVLVATASMELGIDIGSVDLVVQFSSPKKIASFLQRVGRSGHSVGGTSKGIIIPLSRDELVECTALLDSVRRGELDHILMPEEPLDILSQQIIAEVASREWKVDDLYELYRGAYPYRNLKKETFLEIVQMLAEGFTTKRGRRGTYLHYDSINGKIRARRGARLIALTNGGAIPDMFDYKVVLQPDGITVGTLNEDFALESLPGDIFTLGTHSWQLVRIEGLKVIVNDASGKPSTVPFWLGESSARSAELSESVSRLNQAINDRIEKEPLPDFLGSEVVNTPFSISEHSAVRWLVEEVGISLSAAEQLVTYLWMGRIGLGIMPTQKTLVIERFFDELGDTHLVIHSPFGSRVNRGWGLALRKKFCHTFNFELQAAANENSIILSFSSSHSFPLGEVFHYLHSKTICDTLIQAMLDAPLFEVRWRWNATRSLAILRNRAGKQVPPPLQRMQAEDLIAQVFPDQVACFENIKTNREIPEHPLVRQVIHDCLTEAMDIETLEALLRKIEMNEVKLVAKDLREPSVFAQEIINARPYAFLDDTEFAQRRVNAIRNRSWLDPGEARDLSRLDSEAIKRVKEEAWPEARNADELHDALMIHGFLTQSEGEKSEWEDFFEALIEEKRATRFWIDKDLVFWIAAERLPMFQAVYSDASVSPKISLPESLKETYSTEQALLEILRGRFEALGPVTISQLQQDCGLSESHIKEVLFGLEKEGFIFRGFFTPDLGIEEWCERRLLQRIHRYTLESLRQSIQPVSVQDFMRFLLSFHKMDAEETSMGPETLQEILAQLEGFEAPAVSWETDLIPSRMTDYDPVWLDVLCMSGKIVWGRFNVSKANGAHPEEEKKSGPVKNTPISLVSRSNLYLWQQLSQHELSQQKKLNPLAEKIREYLKSHGASFFTDIVSGTGLFHTQVEEGIAILVSQGLVICDSYSGLRALLTPLANRPSPNRFQKQEHSRRSSKALLGIEHAGRWSLVQKEGPDEKEKEDKWNYDALEELVFIYLRRWGVLFRALMEKEAFAPPWSILVRVLRRLELRGELRGGRFVSQFSGEQFALPETVEALRKMRQKPKTGDLISISAADPLNLLGLILPGKKIAKWTRNRIVFRDGIPLAVLEGKEVKNLQSMEPSEQWPVYQALRRGKFPPKLRYYLGKNYS